MAKNFSLRERMERHVRVLREDPLLLNDPRFVKQLARDCDKMNSVLGRMTRTLNRTRDQREKLRRELG